MAAKFKLGDHLFMVCMNDLESEVIKVMVSYIWEGHGEYSSSTEYGVVYDDPLDDRYGELRASNVQETRLYANKSDAYAELERRMRARADYHQSMHNEYLSMCERINKWREEAIAEEAKKK